MVAKSLVVNNSCLWQKQRQGCDLSAASKRREIQIDNSVKKVFAKSWAKCCGWKKPQNEGFAKKKYYMLIFVKTFLKCRFLIFFHLSLTFIIKIQILNPVILLSFRLQSIHFKNAFLPHDATTSKWINKECHFNFLFDLWLICLRKLIF